MSAQPAQFTLPFTHYAQLGYHPCPTAGKVPSGGTGWYDKQYTPEELAALNDSGYNVGLRCLNIVGLDIDVEGAVLAQRVERTIRKVLKLPKSTPRRIGKAPKALLIMRTDEPLKGFDISVGSGKERRVLFQLLGTGKQFVIHGTHPDTHKPYTLDAPLPKWAKLPKLDAALAGVLKEALLDLFESEGYEVRATGGAGKKGTGKWSEPYPWTDIGRKQAADALDKLDPDMGMNEWAQVGFAIYDGTHGSGDGLALWDHWSSGGDKYKPGDCAKRWRGFKAGGGVTKATLFQNNFPKLNHSAGSPDEPVRIVPDDGDDQLGFSARELFSGEVDAVPWVVQDVLTYGAHLLVGRPKGGKSWITLDMAYACAGAGEFVGKQAGNVGVLWIASEDTRDGLARRLKVRGDMPPEGVVILTMESLKRERDKSNATTFDAWLREFLTIQEGSFGLVIIDTHKTVEAIWQSEKIDTRRNASVVDIAYQSVRIYDDIGQTCKACIVLVHHAGKLKNQRSGIVDYHELINLPATAVAGATASMVLADPPDRDIHDEDDHRRVFAVRGRHIIGEAPLLIELVNGRAKSLGTYHEVVQTEAQAETMTALEQLIAEMEPDAKGEKWVTLKQIASEVGKHEKTIAGHFKAMKKDPAKLFWKQWRVVLKASKGVTLVLG